MDLSTVIVLIVFVANLFFLLGARYAEKMAIKSKRIYFYDSKLKYTCVYKVLPNWKKDLEKDIKKHLTNNKKYAIISVKYYNSRWND